MSTCRPASAPLVLAVDLAIRYNGEIINADAMQMYRGLPIITNKISLEEQRSIPHHLLGNIGLDEETWVVGVFKREANRIIQEIRSRGRLPIVVGGTHYYTKALLFKDSLVEKDDASHDSPAVPENSAEHPILDGTTEAMWMKLKEVDPVMADRWHPKDRRKIRRSLEIFLTTGKRASDIYAEQRQRKAAEMAAQDDSSPNADALLLWVHSEDQVLKDRLNKRIDQMLDNGLMDEITEMNDYLQTRLLGGDSVDYTTGIWQSIGFKEFQPYFKAMESGVENTELEKVKRDCLEVMKGATRRYAKYQVKWITKQMMPLLEEQGNMDRLYVLDSTDVARYSENVIDKAAPLAQQFLAGEEMPAPSSVSETARKVLSSAMAAASSSQGTPCRKHCTLCDATSLTEEDWQKHIRGKAHRRRLRATKRTALIPAQDVETALITVDEPAPAVTI
ncbi:tRNA dimethylallyltransferase, mitochondrial [Cytospora mali]|uniref:tRNA dimethylallyltransferase n=1 Tax=Cytospora mali TaxID=578113 RepID=A0A194V1U0_CYTMA|nr:tRNA dimethylallyltransferase, mitochondrial [Valsa mali var. pyri (nom. inval.)]